MKTQKTKSAPAKISIEELAAQVETAPAFAKVGRINPNRDDGVIDHEVKYPVTVASATVQPRNVEPLTPMIVVFLQLEDGRTTTAGIDLPLDELEGVAFGMSADAEIKYTNRAGDKLLRYLRAAFPGQFDVFADIDKSNASAWVYYDAEGNVLTPQMREDRANKINRAVLALSRQFRKGDTSLLIGNKLVLERKPNPNNEKYPYNNFYAAGTEG